jgi:putative endonuclease
MTDPRHRLGLDCESAASAWLARCGWRLLAQRQRSVDGGEVDLIALDPGDVLVAIEVRGRRSDHAGSAIESVDPRRIGRIRRTLVTFARTVAGPRRGLRVDLVCVEPLPGQAGRWRLRRTPGIG